MDHSNVVPDSSVAVGSSKPSCSETDGVITDLVVFLGPLRPEVAVHIGLVIPTG